MESLKNFIIVCGHYGCGKTNYAINLALKYKKQGRRVTIVDMDLVNPYFRTSDYRELLENEGIEVIAPVFAATNLDIPSLPGEMYSVFEGKDIVILDVGGDDVGATVLGRFYPKLVNTDYDFLYVVNRYRGMTVKPQEAAEILNEIERVSRLKATRLVNNSHLMDDTTAETIAEGIRYAKEVSRITGLSLLHTTVNSELEVSETDVRFEGSKIIPINIYVKTIWRGLD